MDPNSGISLNRNIMEKKSSCIGSISCKIERKFTLSAKILSAKSLSAKILGAKSPSAKILSAKVEVPKY